MYAVLMGAGTGAVFAHLALYAHVDLRLPQTVAGSVTAVFGVVGIAARILVGRRADRWPDTGPVLTILALGAAIAVALGAVATHNPPLLWLGAAVFGATGVAWPAIAMLTVVRVTVREHIGVATGWVAAGLFAGLVVMPAAGGWLAERTGTYAATWRVVIGAYLLAAVVAHRFVSRRHSGRSLAEDVEPTRSPS